MAVKPHTLDTRGYRCPVPVIRLEALLRQLADGAQITVFTDDPVAAIDIPYFCQQGGHKAELIEKTTQGCVFLVTRGGKST